VAVGSNSVPQNLCLPQPGGVASFGNPIVVDVSSEDEVIQQ
jgi:hypothetical protein